MADATLMFAQQVLAQQPFSRWLNASITAFAPGMATLTLPVTPDLLQQHGFIHGGVISYAADNVLTFAAGTVLGPHIVTAEYKINYVRPAQGTLLTARATVVASGQRQAVCRADVFVTSSAQELLVAVAQGTIMRMQSAGQPDDPSTV